MNCKPGDFAMIVAASRMGHAGKIVRVVRLASADDLKAIGLKFEPSVWVLDTPLMTVCGFEVALQKDAWLRPIRDPGDDAVDEVIQRIGTPHKEVA